MPEINQLLENAFGEYKSYDTELAFRCPCPDCSRYSEKTPKLFVNISSHVAYCFRCDYRGNVLTLLRDFSSHANLEKYRKEFAPKMTFSNSRTSSSSNHGISPSRNNEIVKLPAGYTPLVKGTLSTNVDFLLASSQEHLRFRGLSDLDIFQYKIGVCLGSEMKTRVIIPSFGLDGHLNYYIAYGFRKGTEIKYLSPKGIKKNDIIFNELNVNWFKPITIVEGFFDSIKAENSIPLLGKNLHIHSRLMSRLLEFNQPIFLGLDGDARKETLLLAKFFLKNKKDIRVIETRDIDDIGSISKLDFLQRRKEAWSPTLWELNREIRRIVNNEDSSHC